MTDQVVVSLGNFLLTVMLARLMSKTEYGVYVVALGALLVANAIHSGLVVYPISVLGAHVSQENIGHFAANALVVTYAFAVPIALVLGATTWILSKHSDLYLLVVGTMLCWQTHETVRRCLMSRLRHRAAILGDTVAYLGQIALVIFLLRLHVQMHAEIGFLAIMLASLVGAGAHAIVIGLRTPNVSSALTLGRESARLGKWPLLTNLGYSGTSFLFPWGLAHRDLAEAATYQAMLNVVQVVNPVMYSVGNVVVPSVAHEMLKPECDRHPRAIAGAHLLQGLALLSPLLIGILLFPSNIASLLYGSGSSYAQHAFLLRILALAAVLMYTGHVLNAYCLGKRQVHAVAKSQIAASAIAIAVAIVLIPLWGPTGAAWSFVTLAAARIGWLLMSRTPTEFSTPLFANAASPVTESTDPH